MGIWKGDDIFHYGFVLLITVTGISSQQCQANKPESNQYRSDTAKEDCLAWRRSIVLERPLPVMLQRRRLRVIEARQPKDNE